MRSKSAKTSSEDFAADGIRAALEASFSPEVASTLLMIARRRTHCPRGRLSGVTLTLVLRAIEDSLPAYLADPGRRQRCVTALREVRDRHVARAPSWAKPKVVSVRSDRDLQIVTEAARDCALQAGMNLLAQTKLMTACAELARNMVQYAGGGELRFWLFDEPRRGIGIAAIDTGPGIADVKAVMSPSYVSRTGMGVGLRGSKCLVDEFEVDSKPGKGTSVTLRMYV